jgi:hypothetical protein
LHPYPILSGAVQAFKGRRYFLKSAAALHVGFTMGEPGGRPSFLDRFFAPDTAAERSVLWPRWIFLRCLGLIFFSAFYSLLFQIRGLIGPEGLLPAGEFLANVTRNVPGPLRFWYVPSVLWAGAGNGALLALVGAGLAASVLLVLNVWPRGAVAVCFVLFLSFVTATQDFSSYQSDGMLLEAAFLCLLFASRGVLPGLGSDQPPSRARACSFSGGSGSGSISSRAW